MARMTTAAFFCLFAALAVTGTAVAVESSLEVSGNGEADWRSAEDGQDEPLTVRFFDENRGAVLLFRDSRNTTGGGGDGEFPDSFFDRQIKLAGLADVTLRSLGLAPVLPSSPAPSYVNENMFDRPRASVFVAVQGMGRSELSAGSGLLSAAPWQLPIIEFLYPRGSVAEAATMATGVWPATHGRGAVHPRKGGHPETATVIDRFEHELGNRVLVACGSRAECDSFASQKQQNLEAGGGRTFFFREGHGFDLGRFVDAAGQEALPAATDGEGPLEWLVRPDIVAALAERGLAVSLGEKRTVVLTDSVSEVSAQFSTYESATVTLLSELHFLSERASANVPAGDTPAAVFLLVSGVDAMAARFGKDSARYELSVRLVDALLPFAVSRAADALAGDDGRVTQVALLGSPPDRARQWRRRAKAEAVADGAVTQGDIEFYQIVLWLSIALAFTLLAASYSLAYMSLPHDTLLYSTFNPTWQRKR